MPMMKTLGQIDSTWNRYLATPLSYLLSAGAIILFNDSCYCPGCDCIETNGVQILAERYIFHRRSNPNDCVSSLWVQFLTLLS